MSGIRFARHAIEAFRRATFLVNGAERQALTIQAHSRFSSSLLLHINIGPAVRMPTSLSAGSIQRDP
jgi:hypothetical protein